MSDPTRRIGPRRHHKPKPKLDPDGDRHLNTICGCSFRIWMHKQSLTWELKLGKPCYQHTPEEEKLDG